jgi:PiT family inorganic phosphate transporter
VLLMLAATLLLVTLAAAFANGANDVSKGVATLAGSGVTDLRRAVWWGAVCTVAGAVAAAGAAQGLVAVFSGKGILAGGALGAEALLAVAIGAAAWVAIATWTGLPVSTTHALVGGLVGAGLAAAGPEGVLWKGVLARTALPLAASPLLAIGLTTATMPSARRAFRRLGRYCVCLERDAPLVALAGSVAAFAPRGAARVVAGADCPPAVVARVNALDSLHWLSAGGTSFARALNDAPKILALGAAAAAVSGLGLPALFVLVALAMGAGSWFGGRRVTATLAGRVTRLEPDGGLAANGATTVLVVLASFLALPVSTTHVATSAIAGTGISSGALCWGMVRRIAGAWLVTVPAAGVVAAVCVVLLGGE